MIKYKEIDELEERIIKENLIFEDIANGIKFKCKVGCQNMCEIFPINLDELGVTEYTRNLGTDELVKLINQQKIKINEK